MTRPLGLSVLDQSPIAEGSTGAEALANTVELARLAERLGYRRYWVAEHHGTPMLACSSPEILIGAIAAATSRIRVGSGGVMLVHYSPFKVAEVFSVLGGLHGDRIDLGVGRAPGTDAQTIFALQRDRRQLLPEDYREQVAELLAYFEDGFPPDHPFARLAQLPGAPGTAEVWLLGASPESAVWAAEWGLRYSVADFINPGGGSGRAALPRALPAGTAPGAARALGRGRGRLRRHGGRGRAARVELAHGDPARAPRPVRAGAGARARARLPRVGGRAPTRSPAAASSSARPTPSGASSSRSRPSTARTS